MIDALESFCTHALLCVKELPVEPFPARVVGSSPKKGTDPRNHVRKLAAEAMLSSGLPQVTHASKFNIRDSAKLAAGRD